MEVILQSLLSADISLKLSACERLEQKVKESSGDIGLKVMSACVGLVKEANLKVVLAGLECLSLFLTNRKEAFASLVNMAFDVLIPRLGDTKVNVREKAKETLQLMVENTDQANIIEKMGANLSNKNVHVKCALLEMFMKLFPTYTAELSSSPKLAEKIAAVLNDQQLAARKSAEDTLMRIKDAFGPALLTVLIALEVKPSVLQKFESMPFAATGRPASVRSSPSHSPSTSVVRRTVSDNSMTLRSRTVSGNLVNEDEDATPTSQSTTSSLAAPINSSADTLGFSVRYFMDFLHGEKEVVPLRINDERDLHAMVDRICNDLGKMDDWNKRIQTLITLQSLTWGTLVNYPDAAQILRKMQDQISVQLADLRSAICKETCKTLAVMAFAIPQQFLTLLELWWPKILRVLAIKIQVMSTAADRCIRGIISCCQDSKLMQLILESCGNKNAILRRLGLEYLALACALWRTDIIEKHLNAIKNIIKVTLSDADAHARKISRVLYWLLYDYSFSRRSMNQLHDELDSTAQKHLQSEGKKAIELAMLASLPRRMLQTMEADDLVEAAPLPATVVQDAVKGPALTHSNSSSSLRPGIASVQPNDMDLLEFDLEPRSNALAGGSRRMSVALTGPARNDLSATVAPSNQSSVASSTLAKGARRMSLASTVLPSSGPLHRDAETSKLSATVATRAAVAAPVTPSTSNDDSYDMSSWLDDDVPSKPVGKENRRLSMSLINHSTSAQLGNGPKRMLVHVEPVHMPVEAAEVKAAVEPVAATSVTVVAPLASSTIEKPLCVTALMKMSEDNSWSMRLKALEDINKRIEKAFVEMEPLGQMDSFLQVAWKCQEDTQLKVASEAMKIIKLALEMFSEQCQDKLDQLVLNVLQQLNDRRQSIREAANDLLTLIRGKYNPNVVVNSIAKVMMDVPDRTKTAVMQYLGVLLPLVSADSMTACLTGLLHHIADMLTAKPSITLTAAAKRILVLLYKISPELVVSEAARMKFPQLSMVKSMLKGVGDIEQQLLTASKAIERPRTAKPAPTLPPVTALDVAQNGDDCESPPPAPPALSSATINKAKPSTPAIVGRMLSPTATPVNGRQVTDSNPIVQSTASSPQVDAQSALQMRIPGTERSLQYVLQGLASTAMPAHRKEVHNLLKKLAKEGDHIYWTTHGHQLLEGILSAVKSTHRNDGNDEEEEALLSLFLLLLRYRGQLIQASKLSLLADIFIAIAVTRPLLGERLLLYTEITSHLSALQPQQTLLSAVVNWSAISWTFPPTDPTASVCRLHCQLLLLHAATQCSSAVSVEVLDGQIYGLTSLAVPLVSSEAIELRKASVFLLVELYLRLQEDLLPYIQSLSTAQRQLMMIYVEKRKVGSAGGMMGNVSVA